VIEQLVSTSVGETDDVCVTVGFSISTQTREGLSPSAAVDVPSTQQHTEKIPNALPMIRSKRCEMINRFS
jgi:hypothetical protein